MAMLARGADDSHAEDLRHDLWSVRRAVHAIIRQLIRRQTLRVQSAETLFVAKQRATSHGHATAEQQIRGSVQPEDGSCGGAQKFRAAGLRVGSTSQGQNRS